MANKQLETIQQDIGTRFADMPTITVSPAGGDPPEKYEVTYTVPGLIKDEDNQITESDNHTIIIEIPFGFPHFPPSCKPASATFHPDFDSAAICLGNYWTSETTLPDLIIHIGRMISGDFYTTENAFNDEAAVWYQEHAAQFPLSTLLHDITPAPPPQEESDHGAHEQGEKGSIDTLDESDLATNFNYLSLEKDLPPEHGSIELDLPPAQEESEPVTEHLTPADRLAELQDNKQFWAIAAKYQDTEDSSPDIDAAVALAAQKITKATELYQEAESIEHKGSADKAYELFLQVYELVADYPNIDDDIQRTEQSKDLLGDWTAPGQSVPSEESAGVEEKEEEKNEAEIATNGSPAATTPPPQQERKGSLLFFETGSKQSLPLVPLTLAAVAVIIGAVLFFFYTSINNRYQDALATFSSCKQQLQSKEFSKAEQSCKNALETAQSIYFIKGDEKSLLINNITDLLSSAQMREGLAGRVMVDGKYVVQQTKETLANFTQATEAGDTAMADSHWQEAITRYTEALKISRQLKDVDKTITEELRRQIAQATVNLYVTQAQESVSGGNWQEALTTIDKGLGLIEQLSGSNQSADMLAPLKNLRLTAKFNLLAQQALEQFDREEWQTAAQRLNEALELSNKLKQPDEVQLKSIREKSIKAQLYITLEQGKKAFANSQWKSAISNYTSALEQLQKNSVLLKEENTAQYRKKLQRIILQATLTRDRIQADNHFEAKKYPQTLTTWRNMVKMIATSPFSKESEFQAISREAGDRIAQAEELQDIEEKKAYLTKEYKRLFLENYAAATKESLSAPRASFVKKVGNNLLFELQCTESGRGRPLRLIMHYIYLVQSDQWRFYSNATD